ncbi:allophanate hydrolase [Yinghuangia sp. ASG 101]|uniref:allophanate hydrolase n=1 Tax=Yinghuangia sp. ASG 101 TaxID=2896848 RepID=UPI001E2BEB5F|nr:allophanate hydrolase [Yinghuangia sp. ASG 101]UGQ13477.1 allophanate hydrolase [Yinghuangia sp. ASG 101]
MTAVSARGRVEEAFRRIKEVDRPEVWILARDEADVLADADRVDTRIAGGDELPLAGLVFAVKDNVDVAGLPTTAACPGFAYTPARTATAAARLVDAGAVLLGKTNLDQFATGLVGTRSPYGAVRNAPRPDRISGGSSSGSAVAVALGIADLAIGTDTAGSGRVPAALNGIVGIKATRGLVPTTGVVPAARPYDCVTVFAASLALATHAMAVMSGPDAADPLSRAWPSDVRLAAPPEPRVAVPDPGALAPLSDDARAAFSAAVDRLVGAGARVKVVDVAPLLAVATLLYDGALVAERFAAVGDFLATEPAGADPTVAAIIRAAAGLPAHGLAADQRRVDEARATAAALLRDCDALLLPTTVGHPTLAEVAADPVGTNSRMGTYTNFVNLLDMAAVAVPAGTADGSPFGVSVITRAFEDQIGIDLAAVLAAETVERTFPGLGVDLVVFGAHRRGGPLAHQLTDAGARFRGIVRTAPDYRMLDLRTPPPKPGIVAAAPGTGRAIEGERWTLSPAALGVFLTALPAPMTLGKITLDTGEHVTAFHCDVPPGSDVIDVTEHGSWPRYLAARNT